MDMKRHINLFSKEQSTFLRNTLKNCAGQCCTIKKNSKSKRKHSKYMNVENNNTMDNNTQK
jgi:hypothetical protein